MSLFSQGPEVITTVIPCQDSAGTKESPLHLDRLCLVVASINSDTRLTAIPWKAGSNGQGHDTLRSLPLATKFIMRT